MSKDLGGKLSEIEAVKISLDTLRIWLEAMNQLYYQCQQRLIDLKTRK